MTNEKKTLNVSQEAHKKAKIKSVEKNLSIGEYIEHLIEKDNKPKTNKTTKKKNEKKK